MSAARPPLPPVRALTTDDLWQGLELSTEARWNQNEDDWRLLLKICRGYGIHCPESGLVGTTMAWEYSEHRTWINMVLVKRAFRGRGAARKLMEACLRDQAAEGRTASLDATAMGADLYAKLDFTGEVEVVRLLLDAHDGSTEEPLLPSKGRVLRPLRKENVFEAAVLDQEVTGMNRVEILVDFQRRQPAAAWALVDGKDKLRGFIVGRNGRVATQLGPIIAETDVDARSLLSCALRHTRGPIIVDAPAAAIGWVGVLNRLGFEPQRNFLRMVRGLAPYTNWACYHAICGPDFA